MFFLRINEPPDWMVFFGHFHPVLVHLPVGMLVVAAMMEILLLKKKNAGLLKNAVVFILFWGFVTAIISCVFGWALSKAGGYSETTLALHKWLGISVAAVAGICWFIKKSQSKSHHNIKTYRFFIFSMTALIFITGHLGGSMTHGEAYLTAYAPRFIRTILGSESADTIKAPKTLANINEAVAYSDIIEPVLQVKCWSCHSAKKIKGGLRMDNEGFFLKGGKDGIVFKPNDAAESEIIKRILLPEGDDNRMPPKGKPAITLNEIKLLNWWINNGADFTKKVKDTKQDEDIKLVLAALVTNTTAAGNAQIINNTGKTENPVFNQKIPPADAKSIAALTGIRINVNPIALGQNFLEVNCIINPGFYDGNMQLLAKLSQQIVWLKLNDTKITDNSLAVIANFKNLVKLNLQGTSITSNGIAFIKALPNLEYINLTGTKIDDKALQILGEIKSIKQVYCWNTAVTKTGVEMLRKKVKGIVADMGDEDETAKEKKKK